MTRRRLARRDRRTIVIGTVMITAISIGARGVPAWLSWKNNAVASAQEIVSEAIRAEFDAAIFEPTLDSIESRQRRLVSLAPALLAVGSPAAGGASLASTVTSAAFAAGVEIVSVQVKADTAADPPLKRVSVQVTANSDIRGVAALLRELERGRPLLAVRELSITQPEPGAADERAESLHVQMRVEGLVFDRTRPAR